MPDLSIALDVSYNHLSKLIQRMRKAGLVRTAQGKQGGVVLLKDPSEINLRMIVDLMDGPTQLSECFGESSTCALDHDGCKLKTALGRVQLTLNTEMEQVRLTSLL